MFKEVQQSQEIELILDTNIKTNLFLLVKPFFQADMSAPVNPIKVNKRKDFLWFIGKIV